MATDLHGTEQMYNRIIGPRTNALSVDQHKSRHGIRLRSMSFPRKNRRGLRSPSSPALSMTTPMATQLVPMVTSSSTLLQREKSFPGATPKGSDMVPAATSRADTPEPEILEEVFPIQYPLLHDEMNRQRAIAAQSFSAGLKIKQVPLPQLYKQEKDQPRSRTPSARGVRTVPVYKDRETPSPAPQATTSRLYLRDTRSPIRNMSEQQRRLQDEEKARMRTKVMKRTAEIVSHRVDRMYYMMGSNVPLLYRYQVDDDELNRLRELSQARSSTSHYGRGLRYASFGVDIGFDNCHRHGPVPRTMAGDSGTVQYLALRQGTQGLITVTGTVQYLALWQGTQGLITVPGTVQYLALRQGTQARSSTSHYGRGLSSGMGKYKQWSQEMAPQDYQAPPDNLPGAATIPIIRHEAEGSSEQLNSTKKHPSPVSSRAEHQQMHSIHIQVERLSLKDGSVQDGPASLNVEVNSSPGGTEKNPSAAGGGERGQQDDIGSAAESVALPGEGEEEEETSGVPTEEVSAWHRAGDGEGSEVEQEEAVPGAGEAEPGQNQSQLDSGGPQLTVSRHSTPQSGVAVIKIVQGDRGPRSRDDVFNTNFENPEEEDGETQQQSTAQFEEGEGQDGEWVPQDGEDDAENDDDDRHGGNNVGEGESFTRSYGEFNVTVRTVEKNGDSLQPESGDRGEGRAGRRKQDNNKTMIGGLRRKGKPEGGYVEPEGSIGGRGDADLAAATEEYYRQLHEGQGDEEEQDEEDAGDGAGSNEDDATRKYPFLKKFMYTFMSSRQQQIFERKFDEIDLEGQGVITMETLKSRMFGNLKERDLDLLMKVFDLNSDKTIDKREFVTVAALNDKLRGITTLSPNDPLELNLDKLAFHIQAYKEMFQVVDTDGDGRLTMEEIMLLLSAAVGTQVGTDKDLVRAIIKVLDKDGNGSIDFVEYLSFIPFFLHIHQHIVKRPISITDVENARQAVQKALSRRSL
uniref:EF-hand domain-containing protein n=1 Tax=Branchiostoma floridae TaxID=7739 RepID=C3Z1B6_BRAFL|eukprot:XP_002597645.1 hypothetical protein BRAFLDRAFT_121691 [Branchiostoma floridae]